MKLEDILKQLKKEKDPLKYLKELLNKIDDEKLKKEIEKLIKSFEKENPKETSRKESTLESAVQSVSVTLPKVETETFESYIPLRRRERIPMALPTQLEENAQPSESYGASVKTDYIRNEMELRQSLETSGLINRTGFNTTSEAKEAIRQKGSIPGKDYNLQEREERIQYHREADVFNNEDLSALPFDLRESHKKRKNSGVYHG